MSTKEVSPVKGLRMLRTANILSIVAVVMAIVGGIVLIIGAGVGAGMASESGGDIAGGAVATAGIGALVALIGALLVLVGGIIQLVGLAKTTSAHSGYKTAMILVLVNIVLSAVSAALVNSDIANTIFSVLGPIVSFLVVYFIITATVALLQGKGDTAVAAKGQGVRTVYMVCTAIQVVAVALAFLPALATAIDVITVVSSLVQLVALFKYIGFLGRAATALEG